MIESTLWFDDIEDVPGLLSLLQAVQRSPMWSRERSGRRPGNEASLGGHAGHPYYAHMSYDLPARLVPVQSCRYTAY